MYYLLWIIMHLHCLWSICNMPDHLPTTYDWQHVLQLDNHFLLKSIGVKIFCGNTFFFNLLSRYLISIEAEYFIETLYYQTNCQAQPKVQTKASAFGWDGYDMIIIHPPGQVWRRQEQNLENESCLSVWVDPKKVFEPCPIGKNSQIRVKNFSISLFLC